MCEFYGTLNGSRGKATRCGTKQSGIETIAASWRGAVKVRVWKDKSGVDMCRVDFIKWQGAGTDLNIYVGPVDGKTFKQMSEV